MARKVRRVPYKLDDRGIKTLPMEEIAAKLLAGFDELIADGPPPYAMEYLKERNRGMILLLLDKVEQSGDSKYIPLLHDWAQVDYRKVRERIGEVVRSLQKVPAESD